MILFALITDSQGKRTPRKQKEFSNMALSCFDEYRKGPDMDKEFTENNLTRLIISNSVRPKSVDSSVAENEDTSYIFDDKQSTKLQSKINEGITTDAVVGSSEYSSSGNKNLELDSINVVTSDSSVNTANAAHPKMNISAPISTEGSLSRHAMNSETDIPVSSVSLVSQDYNFSSSDESNS
jgi:hypothetical protein